MKAIYAYKEFTNHYKPLNDNFYELAKLSLESSKKYYKTVLYCDEETEKKFNSNNLFFDEVILLNKIKNYNGNIYGMPKIFAMLEQSEPYIVLDFDSIILEPIISNHSITYGFYEFNLLSNVDDNDIDWYYHSYIFPFKEHLKEYFKPEEILLFDWTKVPNFSILLINNPHTIKYIFQTIFNRIPLEVIEKCTPTLIEQFLCFQFLNILGVDKGCLINQMYDVDIEKTNFINQKYTHININDLRIKEILELIRNVI